MRCGVNPEKNAMPGETVRKMFEVRERKILLLALGNDILGDDGVGLYAARTLAKKWSHRIEIVEAPIGGFALIDLLHGYDKVLILDSISGVSAKPGTLRELSVDDFHEQSFASPHYVGLKEIVELAVHLEIPFPSEIRILGMEVADASILRKGLSPEIESELPRLIQSAETILVEWACESDEVHVK
ncbi:MAG TPA: hydrogenase maturation protease [Bacteroidota bacterium]